MAPYRNFGYGDAVRFRLASSFRASIRRALLVVAALVLVGAPNLTMSANASLLANNPHASTDPTMLMDDTPDPGPVADAPPPMVGAVNLLFVGVLPDDALWTPRRARLGPSSWARPRHAPLTAFVTGIPARPPRT